MNSETLHLCVHSEALLLCSLLISVIYFKEHIEHVICSVSPGPKTSNSHLITAFHSTSPQSLKSCHTPSPPVTIVSTLSLNSVWSCRLQPPFQVIFQFSLIKSPPLQPNWTTGYYLLEGIFPQPSLLQPCGSPWGFPGTCTYSSEHIGICIVTTFFLGRINNRRASAVSAMSPHHISHIVGARHIFPKMNWSSREPMREWHSLRLLCLHPNDTRETTSGLHTFICKLWCSEWQPSVRKHSGSKGGGTLWILARLWSWMRVERIWVYSFSLGT